VYLSLLLLVYILQKLLIEILEERQERGSDERKLVYSTPSIITTRNPPTLV
jgi:hypothetical protein